MTSHLSSDSSRPASDQVSTETRPTPVPNEIRMYATAWCGDCRRSKRVFDAMGISYTYIDIERDTRAEQLVLQLNRGKRSVPTIVFPDGSVLTEPSNAELEAKLRALATI